MNNKIIIILTIAAVLFGYQKWQNKTDEPKQPAEIVQTQNAQTADKTQTAPHSDGTADGSDILRQAFEEQRSDVQVQGMGVVKKTLPDDNKGSRHQRFILQIADGQTLLVAHNIDLAEKIKGLKKGDRVEFYGEYEWSEQGGVMHWTHHDPSGRHEDGWLKHNGKIYQ